MATKIFSGLGAEEICVAVLGRVPPFFNQYDQQGKFIVINGSGEHHDLTFKIIEALPQQEITYVHLDSHNDCNSSWELDCGSFVVSVSLQKNVKKIIFAGTEMRYMPKHVEKEKCYYAPSELDIEELIRNITTQQVYISTDLDVLVELRDEWVYYDEAGEKRFRINGNWFCEGNKLNLDTVTNMIHEIGRAREVVAADICGALLPLSKKMICAYETVYSSLLAAMETKRLINPSSKATVHV